MPGRNRPLVAFLFPNMLSDQLFLFYSEFDALQDQCRRENSVLYILLLRGLLTKRLSLVIGFWCWLEQLPGRGDGLWSKALKGV